jgi:polyphosphate kinase 2
MGKKDLFTLEELKNICSRDELLKNIKEKKTPYQKIEKTFLYEEELRNLQIELVKLQRYISKENKRLVIIFEGRDAAGKGGNIRRFTEHLSPRSINLVALTKPTEIEKGQWYFRRYIKELSNSGEMVFFDRSWYNRAVVEPVMGFCTKDQYNKFMLQVPDFEHMLYEDGIIIIKFWFSISKDVQKARFDARLQDPLKRWKFSPVDEKGQELWDTYTYYKEQMFSKTHTTYCPWTIVKANDKKVARLESIRYVLSQFDYPGKDEALTTLFPDPNIIMRYYRSSKQLDF